MSVKRYKLALTPANRTIRKARKSLKKMPKPKQIELTVKAGAMTEIQAERARKKLAEMPA
jgi:hypothetical protein